MKYCKECGTLNQNPLVKYCIKHNKLNKRIQQVSDKKRQRIKDTGGEKGLFKRISFIRPPFCEICGEYIKEYKTWCFAHILPKGKYPVLRLFENNIHLVCSIECHNEVDRRSSNIGKEILKQLILNGETIKLK